MSPRWPPLEGPCEMGVGVDEGGPMPQVIKCHRPGVERTDVPTVIGNPILCDGCYPTWKEIRHGRRR